MQTEKTKSIREAMARQTEEIKKQAKIVKNDLDFLDALNQRTIQQPVSTHTPLAHTLSTEKVPSSCCSTLGHT